MTARRRGLAMASTCASSGAKRGRRARGPGGRSRPASIRRPARAPRPGAGGPGRRHRPWKGPLMVPSPASTDLGWLGPGAGGRHPHGQRGGGQLVLGQQHQGGVERSQPGLRGSQGRDARPQLGRHRTGPQERACSPTTGSEAHQRLDEEPTAAHRGVDRLGPRDPRRGADRRGGEPAADVHLVGERSSHVLHRCQGLGNVAGGRRALGQLAPELARPQQLARILERGPGGQVGQVVVSVADPAVADLAHGGADDHVDGARLAARGPGPALASQELDLVGVVAGAASRTGAGESGERPAAGVGVHGGHVDPEAVGHLGGGERLLSSTLTIINVDHLGPRAAPWAHA